MDNLKKLFKVLKAELSFWCLIGLLMLIFSCNNKTKQKELAHNRDAETSKGDMVLKKPAPKEFNAYWYAGEAEISSYKLEQARYGELREGTAVLIYVTEDFLPEIQVKADNQNPKNISVLKLNATKNFNTGVYPYSIMQSTFYPISNDRHALKVSSSMQEWCGHVYAQLNNREQLNIMTHSYFEGEADSNITIDKAILENELWTKLRIHPNSLPTGKIQIVPSFEYLRLKHVPIKAYQANANLSEGMYTLDYPELNRTLSIHFDTEFPFEIESWEESFKSGFGASSKMLTTKATKLKTIKSPYWQKNKNEDVILRETLHLN